MRTPSRIVTLIVAVNPHPGCVRRRPALSLLLCHAPAAMCLPRVVLCCILTGVRGSTFVHFSVPSGLTKRNAGEEVAMMGKLLLPVSRSAGARRAGTGAGLSDASGARDRGGGRRRHRRRVVTRVLGEELYRRWGQPVVVENRSGGASNIGARACADAPPDGYYAAASCRASRWPITSSSTRS